MDGRWRLRLGGVSALYFLFVSCVSRSMGPTVVSYNRAVEQAQNSTLLLNVVRAAKWKPMYLTDMSKVTGQLKRDMTAGASIPFGRVDGGTGATYTVSPSLTYSVNPTFDIDVLDTQDFMKGFLTPVSPTLLEYFWEQGWPHALLLHLFVSQVDVDGKPRYVNHPRFDGNNDELKNFSAWVTDFLAQEPRFADCVPSDSDVGPPVTVSTLKDLLAVAKDTDLSLERVPGSATLYQLKRTATDVRIVFGPQSGDDTPPCDGAGKMRLLQAFTLPGEPGKHQTALHLRSPEAVLYYLGQIVRLETRAQIVPRFAMKPSDNPGPYRLYPIFVAFPVNRRDASGRGYPAYARAAVDVTDNDGDRYIVPAGPWPAKQVAEEVQGTITKEQYLGPLTDDPGTTVDVFSIVTQLIALQKSGKDFPKTGLVRVVGQ